ncbi:MAG TPA: hypothetical protein VFV87_11905, partial [Pirellulaceae bacterium]|nr:hypothetical protein [Pirellulaceae bacterium]
RRLGLLDQTAAQSAADLRLEERVITMDSIKGKLAGISRLVVGGGSIITPAVKDELRQRNIELVRQSLRPF